MLTRIASIIVMATCAAAASAGEPRFRVEVMAILSRAGCNQGACHGNLNGKGGFKLSLRGEDPTWDLGVLTRDASGRRINSLRPEESLILKKATGSIPHEGGRRFSVDSEEYALLCAWIADGARDQAAPTVTSLRVEPSAQTLVEPLFETQIRAVATFSDGQTRDVTRLAAYEISNPTIAEVEPTGRVRKVLDGEVSVAVRFLTEQATVRLAFVPARPDFRWSEPPEANFIDRHIFGKLRQLRLNPAALADDSVFLRRVFLDVIGTLPTAAELRSFLADTRPDRRTRVVDELLRRPEFADYWALKWSDLLRNEEKVLDRKGVEVFHAWIRTAISEGRPLNEFAGDLIRARGSTYSAPAANYYRGLRDPLARAEAAAQVFLGIRLQCCRCHNHPFDRWTQDDYYRLAAFFPRVQYRIVANNRRDRFDKHEFDGEQIVWFDRESEMKHPRTGDSLAPKFLAGGSPDSARDRLDALADWVARPENPFFARTQANRIWAHLLGRGLVDPIDDFRGTNPPTHPELLDELATEFTRMKFDLRSLIRTIVQSRTYQLAPLPSGNVPAEDMTFAQARVRRLEAEVILDALASVLEVPVKFDGKPLGMRAIQLPGVQQKPRGSAGDAERFMKAFNKPDRLLSCECERGEDVTVPQSLVMLTGTVVQRLIEAPDNRIGKLIAVGASDRFITEELFLASVARFPSDKEKVLIDSLLKNTPNRRRAFEDLVWALVNSKEFMTRR